MTVVVSLAKTGADGSEILQKKKETHWHSGGPIPYSHIQSLLGGRRNIYIPPAYTHKSLHIHTPAHSRLFKWLHTQIYLFVLNWFPAFYSRSGYKAFIHDTEH